MIKTSTQVTSLRRVVELASRAPSVHNTQPWRWRVVDGSTLELRADRSRQLPVSDPDGRNLAISCGAAVQHAAVAASALGLTPDVALLPSHDDPDLLARIAFTPGRVTQNAVKTLDLLETRRTDRRRFTSWPVPDARLGHLAEAASGWGAYAIPITDVSARFRTELLVNRALTIQESDERFLAEQEEWIARGSGDGVPVINATPGAGRPGERPNRYLGVVGSTSSSRLVESTDGLMAICTAHDDQLAWLEAGEALSALWLRATSDGLAIVPLSQVIEVADTRTALWEEVFAGMAHPQILIRVGWQEIARATLPRTPRRPVDDVLDG